MSHVLAGETQVMQAIEKVWTWLKKWGLVVAGVLLALMGAGWLWRRQRAQLGRVQDELAVAQAQSEIAALERVRRYVLTSADTTKEQVQRLDEDIAKNRRAIVEAHENGQGLSDAEVEDAFARLGY